jgi:hypothetical protein
MHWAMQSSDDVHSSQCIANGENEHGMLSNSSNINMKVFDQIDQCSWTLETYISTWTFIFFQHPILRPEQNEFLINVDVFVIDLQVKLGIKIKRKSEHHLFGAVYQFRVILVTRRVIRCSQARSETIPGRYIALEVMCVSSLASGCAAINVDVASTLAS